MRKIAFAAAAALLGCMPASAFEVYKDYTPSKEVWSVSYVRVNPNRLDDYLEGLRQTWWTGCEVRKKQGRVIDCSIYASETMANRDFNLMLVVKTPSAAAGDPDEKLYSEMMSETRKMLAEDKEKKLVENYDTLRTFFGEQTFRKLTFK